MKKITVIGEVLYDVYSNYKAIGGAPFNFAFHVNKLIRDVRFISAVGNDEDGKDIIDFMKKNDFDSPGLPSLNFPSPELEPIFVCKSFIFFLFSSVQSIL